MKWHELSVPAKVNRKRVGRGIGSGYGKTAGRGTKGQLSRAGGTRRPGFEGGQNPLYMRLPKQRGFKSHRDAWQVVHTDQLNQFAAKAKVTNKVLAQAGLTQDIKRPVKLLERGKLEKSVTVELQAASQTALKSLEKAGGKFSKTVLTPQLKADKP